VAACATADHAQERDSDPCCCVWVSAQCQLAAVRAPTEGLIALRRLKPRPGRDAGEYSESDRWSIECGIEESRAALWSCTAVSRSMSPSGAPYGSADPRLQALTWRPNARLALVEELPGRLRCKMPKATSRPTCICTQTWRIRANPALLFAARSMLILTILDQLRASSHAAQRTTRFDHKAREIHQCDEPRSWRDDMCVSRDQPGSQATTGVSYRSRAFGLDPCLSCSAANRFR
jgi:hypothetical protein